MSAQHVFEFFIQTYQVKLHDAMVFRATKLAKQKCEDEEREQYAMLRDYAHEILRFNSGSTVSLQVQPETHEFEMLYICLEAWLDAAIKEVCDGAPHKFCSRHIWANLTKHAKCNGGELRRALRNCAKATTLQRFTQCMNVLRRINQIAAEYLGTIDPSRWSRSAFDTVCKNDALTSNMCEQFNKEPLKVRSKLILTSVEGVREYITRKKIRCQTLLAGYNGFLCPKVQVRLEEHRKNSNGWVPLWAGDPYMSQFEMPTFAEASFFQPMTAPPVRQPLVRPPPVKPPPIRPHHTPITAHTMEAASSGTAARDSIDVDADLTKDCETRSSSRPRWLCFVGGKRKEARPCCSSSSTPQVSGEGGKDIQLDGHLDLVPDDPSVSFLESEGDLDHNRSSETDVDETLKMEMPLAVPYGSGTRAGLFRTPISCGVQSATSAHGLPQPALAVRNLMEQARRISLWSAS
ncbi:hypothetical protein CRG98_017019 [Punica granatum]|uniref:Uncharacterized protein n=1 Tax=Punica granatum TaxID=22663 RepID=A0A2I0K217_PUNGR|nr:hypothetical protein CRG98_017019 [Punica granatum]